MGPGAVVRGCAGAGSPADEQREIIRMAERENPVDAVDIEITPEMIKAGIEEYALFDSVDPGEWVVSAIYRAMRRIASEDQ